MSIAKKRRSPGMSIHTGVVTSRLLDEDKDRQSASYGDRQLAVVLDHLPGRYGVKPGLYGATTDAAPNLVPAELLAMQGR